MTTLQTALDEYLQVRRALGYKLKDDERLLRQFVEHVESSEKTTVTAEGALAWATMPPGTRAQWWGRRLGVIRGFATYLQTIDPAAEVPPPLPGRKDRLTPYLYSAAEIVALITAAENLLSPLAVSTYQALIGLLAVTGLRVGEAIAADREDLDLSARVLVVKQGKFSKSRALPLHTSTAAALGAYLRDARSPTPETEDAVAVHLDRGYPPALRERPLEVPAMRPPGRAAATVDELPTPHP